MAKLKILDGNGNPIPQGYINVAKNLYKDSAAYQDFADAEPTERPALLQASAGHDNAGNAYVIKQLRADNVTEEAIDATNCRIVGEKDKQRNGKRSTVSVFIPTAPVTDFSYLSQYTKIIHDFYHAGDIDKANKFMFGAMLLTHCR